MLRTTLGQLIVNEALPEEERDYTREWNKRTMNEILQRLAETNPEKYADVTHKLIRVGQTGAMAGNFSFSLKDFQPSEYKRKRAKLLNAKVRDILDDNKLSNEQKKAKVILLLGKEITPVQKNVMDEAVKGGNRLAKLIHGGSKGSPSQFNTTVGIPLLFLGQDDNPVPMPVLNSVAEGLDPAEYWASSYGTRKGTISTKYATQEAGYFGKKLALAAHRGVVTADDCGTPNGIAVNGDDHENIGAVLQLGVAGIPAGTVIGPEHLKKLKGKKVIIRSPMTCEADGLCAKCSGVRDRGTFPEIGDNVGLAAAMSLSERLSQMMLNVKHGGGAAGSKHSYSFQDVERLFEMPKHNIGSAAVAQADGTVKSITAAPAGGVYVKIGEEDHWVPSKEEVAVKVGDMIDAGDVISRGIPNPAEIAKFKGIGEARREFVDSLKTIAGNTVNRRNVEVIARSLVNHVNIVGNKAPNGTLPGDTVRYDDIVKNYTARDGSKMTNLAQAKGKYLEQPVLHYTIGTKLNNKMINNLKEFGINKVLLNDSAPDFEPEVKRLYEHSQHDPDWMVSMGGYNLKSRVLEGVARGDTSELKSTSYIPSVARGTIGKETATTGKY